VAGFVGGLGYWALGVGVQVARDQAAASWCTDVDAGCPSPSELTGVLRSGAVAGLWYGLVLGVIFLLGSMAVGAYVAPKRRSTIDRLIGLAAIGSVILVGLAGLATGLAGLEVGLEAALDTARFCAWVVLLAGSAAVLLSRPGRYLPAEGPVRPLAGACARGLLLCLPLALAVVVGLGLLGPGLILELGALGVLVVSLAVRLPVERRRLPGAPPRQTLRAITSAVLVSVAAGSVLFVSFGRPAAILGGLTAGLVTGLGVGLLGATRKTWLRLILASLGALVACVLSFTDWTVWLAFGIVVMFSFGVLTRVAFGPGEDRHRPHGRALARQFLSGAAGGFLIGLAFWFAEGVATVMSWQLYSRRHPDAELRRLPTLASEIGGHVDSGVTLAMTFGLAYGLLFVVTSGFSAPVDIGTAISPDAVLRTDRRNTISRIAVIGLAGAVLSLSSAFVGSFWYGVREVLFGLEMGLLFGVAVGLANAWIGWLVLVRVYLPLTGRLPWRIPRFLAEAHDRGLLRQAGAVYQFRHARLQDRLVDRGPRP
jgi:hypothetical protein